MKHTLFGFSQRRAMELGLTVEDLAILRWFVDFNGTGKMQKFQTDDGFYVWVSYKKLLEDMPILNCNKRNLAAKLSKMVDAQVLKNKTIRAGGSFSTFALGANFEGLISDLGGCLETDNGCPKSDRGGVRNQTGGLSENGHTNIVLLKDSSITNNTPLPPEGEKEKPNVYGERFAKFWAAYPRKQAKGNAEKVFMRLKVSAALLDKMLEAIAWQKTTEEWKKDNGQFIPHPASWLNSKRWEDEKSNYTTPASKYNFVN